MDLGYVNKCLDTKRVKYEDWKVVLSYFEQDAYMFSFNLKSGYHPIEIQAIKYSEVLPGKTETSSRFCISAHLQPYMFTKVLKPPEKHCRHNRISIAVF